MASSSAVGKDHQCPGAACQKLGISERQLLHGELSRLSSVDDVSNGLVLELNRFCSRKKLQTVCVVDWLMCLLPADVQATLSNQVPFRESLKSHIRYVHERRVKFQKRKQYDCIELLEAELFKFPLVENIDDTNDSNDSGDICLHSAHVSCQTEDCVLVSPSQRPMCLDVSCQTKGSESRSVLTSNSRPSRPTINSNEHGEVNELTKKVNILASEITVKSATLKRINSDIKVKRGECKDLMQSVSLKKGYYSKKYIDQRQQYAAQMRKKLRKDLSVANAEIKSLNDKLDDYKIECVALNDSLKTGSTVRKKILKSKRYFARKPYKASQCSCKPQLNAKSEHIRYLENEVLELQEALNENNPRIHTKAGGKITGAFTDDVVMCTMVLLSLDVAAAKVSKVIRAVAVHVFHSEIGGLPNLQSAINIADRGHYLCKRYIAKELLSGAWGLNKDGTTRRKEKIVDIAFTLPTGKVMVSGYKRVAHEDSATTAELCKEELHELAELHSHSNDISEEDYIESTLFKMSFMMNDRAASEKAANRKFLEWRDTTLPGLKPKVHHFNCSAHVLLGFHRAAVKCLKEKQVSLENDGIKLGRRALPSFRAFRGNNAVEQVACDAASVFGPVGHYLGLRDRWEADCSARDQKSYMTAYKDNRFNGLFQSSLQIFYHREQFLELLDQVEVLLQVKRQTMNKKISTLRSDLKCDTLMALTQSVGIMFVHVTGPFWRMVNSKDIQYLDLYKYFQPMFHTLEALSHDPSPLLTEDLVVIPGFPPTIDELSKAALQRTLPSKELLVRDSLSALCKSFLTTVNNQLKDFLPGGQYSTQAEEDELQRTAFSHLTNISCEHHLGSLDSSQLRRPNASYHYHSSVQLLKKTLPYVLNWIQDMPAHEKSAIMAIARLQGPQLRRKHMQHYKEQETIVNDELLKAEQDAKRKAAKRLLKNAKQTQAAGSKAKKKRTKAPETVTPLLTSFTGEMVGKYVAVAYSEPSLAWFPGIVTKVNETSTAEVRFMTPETYNKNCFSWPERDDIEIVEAIHVIGFDLNVDPIGRMGRRWKIVEFHQLKQKFSVYCKNV